MKGGQWTRKIKWENCNIQPRTVHFVAAYKKTSTVVQEKTGPGMQVQDRNNASTEEPEKSGFGFGDHTVVKARADNSD